MPTSRFSGGYKKPPKGYTPPTKSPPPKVKVTIPYAPTAKGKAAERAARGHVTVPYAPTAKGQRAEHAAALVKYRRALKKAGALIPANPETAYSQARYAGIKPPTSLKADYGPKAYERAEKGYIAHLAENEGIHADPIAEFAIDTAATAGLGGIASGVGKLAGTAAKGGAESLLAGVASKEATAGSTVAEKAGSKLVAKIKGAPSSAAKRAKAAPRSARSAVTTSEGRQALKAAEAKRLQTAGSRAFKKPVRTTGAANAAAFPLGVHTPVSKRANAYVVGTTKALAENPLGTLETTARTVPAMITGPAALLESAGASVLHGSTKPFAKEASKQVEGLVEIGGKLFSGNEAEVQQATEHEVGLSNLPLIPFASRVRELEKYKALRGGARGTVTKLRDVTRAKRRGELAAYKAGERSKMPRAPRHAVIDTATGQERIFRRTGKAIEGHRQRKAVAGSTAREKARGVKDAALASKPVVREIRRSKLARGRKHNIGDVLATVAQYGISRKRELAMRQVKEAEASIGVMHPDEIPAGTITDLQNFKWMRDHPEMFTDKHFWKAVDAYKQQAKAIETSGRKKVLAVGDVYGIARPEERLEAGVKVHGKTVATHFYKEQDTIQRKQAELSALREDAKSAQYHAEHGNAEDVVKAQRIARVIAGRAKKLERELKDYRAGFKQAGKDYQREVQATIREKGLEQPAYVKDVRPRQGLSAEPAFPGGRSAVKQHMARGGARARGIAARDFETLVNKSIGEPRMRRSLHRATTEFVNRWAHPINGKRYITSQEIERAINRGELDPEQFSALHSQHFKQAILDPHKEGAEFLDEVRGSLNRGMTEEVAGRASDTGNKYVVVPKEALREFVHQMEPPKGLDKLFGGVNRFFTRAILGFSPSWAVAQLVAEGIPALVSIGANPLRWKRVMTYLAREDRRLSQHDRAAIDGMVGESAGVTPHPQTQFNPDTNLMASRFMRLSSRNPLGRTLLAAGKGDILGYLDRWKGGKFRKAVAAAKADKQLNGFARSLSDLMRGQRSVIEAIKGKPLAEQMAYIANHPDKAAALEGSLDAVMGNFRALTRHEAKLAPLVIFYPFIRYSLRWMFWSFPKEHPVKASILFFLAQQNSNELEKIIGGKPASFFDYAKPVYTNSEGKNSVVPGGTRLSMGLNAITESIGSGKIEGLANGLNPGIGIGNALINGVDSFTGEKVATSPIEHALLAANQLLSTFAPARYLGLNTLGEGEQSASSKFYEQHDQAKQERSIWNPLAPQTAANFRASERFSKGQTSKYADPIPELSDNPAISEAIYGINGKGGYIHGEKAPLEKLIKEHRVSEKAANQINKLESQFYSDQKLTKHQEDLRNEAYERLTGGIFIPAETPKEKRRREAIENPFGLPSTSTKEVEEEFGLTGSSTADLEKEFGLK